MLLGWFLLIHCLAVLILRYFIIPSLNSINEKAAFVFSFLPLPNRYFIGDAQ